jgi:hypothetical protein
MYTLNWRYQYMAWCGVQAAVEALLPLWALAPLLTGGLQLTPQHTGIALAAAGAALATAHIGTDNLRSVTYFGVRFYLNALVYFALLYAVATSRLRSTELQSF